MFSNLIIISLYINVISAEWVKLPNISPVPTKSPKVVFKLAPPPKDSILSSEMVSNVFSFIPSIPTSTTDSTIFNDNLSTRKSYIRHYFQSTVTSKVINVVGNIASNMTMSDEYLQPVVLEDPDKNNNKKVMYFNKTVQMNVIPAKIHQIFDNTSEKFGSNSQQNVNYENFNDDGITITDEPEDIYYDDEYYYEYDEDETTKFYPIKPTSTTTTEMPPKTHKKKNLNQKLQRRTMIQIMKNQQYKPFGDISFPNFIRFLKKIQESFAIRTAKTIGDKIKMLVHFRDQLMLTINKQIRRLWKGQPQAKVSKNSSNIKRTKRTLGLDHSHGSGAMDFPSAEGALLSICFLTFAVFLIKLVLVSTYS